MQCGALPQLSFSSMLFGRPFFRSSHVLATVLDRRHLRDSGSNSHLVVRQVRYLSNSLSGGLELHVQRPADESSEPKNGMGREDVSCAPHYTRQVHSSTCESRPCAKRASRVVRP